MSGEALKAGREMDDDAVIGMTPSGMQKKRGVIIGCGKASCSWCYEPLAALSPSTGEQG